MIGVDAHGNRSSVNRGGDVALAVADHDAAGGIGAERAGRVEDEFRFGFAAVTIVFGCVRANEEPCERAEEFVDPPIDGINLLGGNETAADAALIADDC